MSRGGHQAVRPSDPLQPGVLLAQGVFRVVEPLGADPFGRSYKGRRESDSHDVLVRQVHRELFSAPGARARLLSEVEVVQALSHRGLAPVLGLFPHGPHREDLLLVEAAPAGQSLRQMIDKKQRSQRLPLSLKGAYHAVSNVCNALTYAHGAFPHGALCAELVDVAMTGQVRVFGLLLGRSLAPERLGELSPGARSCVAPERLEGGPATVAADLYALGALLLEALTLRLAEPGVAPPRPSELSPDLPPGLDEVIATCLRADPAERYPSPQALKEALSAAVQGGGKATVSRPIPALSGGGQGTPGAAPAGPKVSEQLPAVISPTRAREPLPGRPENGLQSTPPGTTMTTPNTPPPKLSGPQGAVSGTVDEDQDRFLITKEDRMDYGPFPLREVRSQIEKGTVTADHLILDMESGDRRRIREHPLLQDMAREWEGKHAQLAMELRDQSERAKHRASVQKLLSGIFIVLLVVGGGVGAYFKFFYKPEVKTVVVKEPSSDDFFKGIEISMKVDPPAPKKHHGKGKKVLKNGKWEDSTSLGDASEDGGDETLSGEQVQQVMNKNFKVLAGCLKEEAQRNPAVKRIDIEFLIKGTGNVSSVKVNGESGSAVAGCVFAKMQSVQFPKFNGAKTHAAFSLALK